MSPSDNDECDPCEAVQSIANGNSDCRTTTTEAPGGCPSSGWCEDTCQDEYWVCDVRIPLCESYDCSGDYKFDHSGSNNCDWYIVPLEGQPCDYLGIGCGDYTAGYWELHIGETPHTWTCGWRKAATTSSCPDGIYYRYYWGCEDCDDLQIEVRTSAC